MTLFRETTITWDGTDYKFVPSMKLLREIEGEGISIMSVAYQVSQGRPQASHMAYIMARCLFAAGAVVSEEFIFAYLSGLEQENQKSAMELYQQLMIAITPTPPKKPDDPSDLTKE